MTATAVMMGSPLYMAPEQMASARDVDGRSDIWSLGIILHAMLTGSPPFRAPSVMQVYELIVQGAPPIRKQRAEVPEGIEVAILKCLQKDRRQRYSNVGELAEAIAAFGPPESQYVANRIKRIISARSTQDSIPIPESGAEPAVVAITPAAVASTDVAPGSKLDVGNAGDGMPAPTSMGLGGVSQVDPLGTHGPWDQKTHPPTKRPRQLTLIAAVAAVLIGAPVAYLALRSGTKDPVVLPNGGEVTGRLASASAAQGALPPPVVVVDPVPPSVSPGVSATAPEPIAVPKPSADPNAGRRGGGRHQGPTSPPPSHRKSPDDLFGTQK
jgi:hypothetical protein